MSSMVSETAPFTLSRVCIGYPGAHAKGYAGVAGNFVLLGGEVIFSGFCHAPIVCEKATFGSKL